MGRKIPGKKHRGIKDPLVQLAQREERLKLKINAPPMKLDYQEIPKSLERVMLLKKLTKEGRFNSKRKRNRKKQKLLDTAKLMDRDVKLPGMTKPDKVLPSLVQRPGEHDHQFIARVGRVTEELINEIKFEQTYAVDVKRNAETGDVEKVEKKVPDEVDVMFEKKRAEMMKPKRKKSKVTETTHLSKSEKVKMKRTAKKQKLKEEYNDVRAERQVDHVQFGEVVHQPPTITVRPRKATVTDVNNKPGRKPNLLLNRILKPQDRNLTGKRKDLSMRDRIMLETERQNVVAAYRQLKANRV